MRAQYESRKQAVEVNVKLELDTGSENQVKRVRPTRGSWLENAQAQRN
jgi:hypothetical protein